MQSTKTIDNKMYLGTSRTLTNNLMPPYSTTNITMVEIKKPANKPQTKSPLVWNSKGPGVIPWSIKPPKIIAVTVSPGIPNVSKGIKAPPMEALLEVSEAITPSMQPV